jgi:hypothetical protein
VKVTVTKVSHLLIQESTRPDLTNQQQSEPAWRIFPPANEKRLPYFRPGEILPGVPGGFLKPEQQAPL